MTEHMVNGKPHVTFDRRKSYCPSCQTVRGTAFQVSAEPDRLVITYQCEACGKQWDVQCPTPVIFEPIPLGINIF